MRINNKGSAIVSVIVVTAFISILATTILYTTGMNYRIKANDYQNKQTFYKAEQALDELKAALVEDVSAAYAYAYSEVAAEYSQLTAEKRAAEYNKAFAEYLGKLWKQGENEHVKIEDNNYAKALEKYFEDHTHLDADKYLDTTDTENPVSFGEPDPTTGQMEIKNVTVKYAENGYITYIRTNIQLNAPKYNWNESADPYGDGVLRMSDCVVYTGWTKY